MHRTSRPYLLIATALIWTLPLLSASQDRLTTLGRTHDVRRTETALTAIDDAQRMTGKLDRDANARAVDAAKTLADVLDSEAKQ